MMTCLPIPSVANSNLSITHSSACSPTKIFQTKSLEVWLRREGAVIASKSRKRCSSHARSVTPTPKRVDTMTFSRSETLFCILGLRCVFLSLAIVHLGTDLPIALNNPCRHLFPGMVGINQLPGFANQTVGKPGLGDQPLQAGGEVRGVAGLMQQGGASVVRDFL